MEAEIPPLDPRPLLTMSDMGHGGHGASDAGPMDHAHMDHSQMSHAPVDSHAGHAAPAPTSTSDHPPTERTPLLDMQVDQPKVGLDDPGVGLRNNGRRVLTYADLHTIGGPIDRRQPGREIQLHLTGHMERFVWSFNGQKFSEAKPLKFRLGERLRITLINDSMMTHPIHLHGMWSEIEDPSGNFQVRKHTVNVQPAQKLSYAVTADALGRWAYHCHLLYHMEAGMFREVHVEPDEGMAHHEGHGDHS
jgi:CopA family copper-resistance protein